MNLRFILEAFFLQKKGGDWDSISNEDKCKLFVYIMRICSQKNLLRVSKLTVMAQKTTWEQRYLILNLAREYFSTDKRTLYQISWFSYPKKIKDVEIDIEALEYYLKSRGIFMELSEVMKDPHKDTIIKKAIKEYKPISKFLKK